MAGTVTQTCLRWYDVNYISLPNANFCFTWRLRQKNSLLIRQASCWSVRTSDASVTGHRPCETGASHSGDYEHSILVCDAVKFGND